jgi:starch-binding outer membrane protein, SusD/RagB family
MYRKSILLSLLVFLALTISNCSDDFLDVGPKGVLTEEQLTEPEHVEGYIISAYSWIPSANVFQTMNPWLASFRSDDAYKGGGGLDDQTPWLQMELFSQVTPNVGNNDGVWYNAYQGISRVHEAMRALERVDESEFPNKSVRIAEMHFLRGWIYFKLKKRYKWIPWFDETATAEDIEEISNRPDAMTDLDLWQKIYDDFKYAADNLPPFQSDLGRASQYAAEAYLTHTLMWMAYEQNDNHQVTNINHSRLEEALTYANSIIESGQFALEPDYAHIFMEEFDNNTSEEIWGLKFSYSDGTPNGNLNWGNGLNSPWWSPHFSCCDFHKPSYNMVNAFRTDPNGLPLFDTFNDEYMQNREEFLAENTWDPRIGHTIAIPGLPWKYQQDILYEESGSRQPQVYGYLHSMKENVRTDGPSLYNAFWMFDAKNQAEVRYPEVLLWKAEILIELGRQDEALPIINEIRDRAANSTDRLIFSDGSPTLDYNIEQYIDGVNINWTQETAREILRWERRLEFAMEGRRFFDLVRWGIASEIMNDYFEREYLRSGRSWLAPGEFVSGRDEYLPIPQPQINWSRGLYVQNPGYGN